MRFRFLSHVFGPGENGGFGASLLLDLVRVQVLDVVPQVGFQVHALVLPPFHVLKGGVQHPWEDARVLGGSWKQPRASGGAPSGGGALVSTLDGVGLPSVGDAVAEDQHVGPAQKSVHLSPHGAVKQLRLARVRPENLKFRRKRRRTSSNQLREKKKKKKEF